MDRHWQNDLHADRHWKKDLHADLLPVRLPGLLVKAFLDYFTPRVLNKCLKHDPKGKDYLKGAGARLFPPPPPPWHPPLTPRTVHGKQARFSWVRPPPRHVAEES
jgi:hypothetical protein